MLKLIITDCRGKNETDDYVVDAVLTSDNPRVKDILNVLTNNLISVPDLDKDRFQASNGVIVFTNVEFTTICLGTSILAADLDLSATIITDDTFFKEDLDYIASFYYKLSH